MMLRSRQKQLIISAAGALLIVPWGAFFGVMFLFAWKPGDGSWPWVFDIVTFWIQVVTIVFSFFKPRVAVHGTFASVSVSVLMALTFTVRDLHGASEIVGLFGHMMEACQILLTASYFWGLPLWFAFLLYINEPGGS